MEVETDCQALRDILMNDKLSAAHARWRDGVLAHNIVDVRHIPGITNIADGISRQYEGTPKTGDDNSEWDVDSNWESGAGLVYGMNYVSIPPATQRGGHFHHDLMKMALLDKIHTPHLDQAIVKAISDCARCKNFGGTHLHALLQPITRRHPFELLVGDYLSMPPGKGGFHTIGLYLDTFTQHVWGFKFKTAGTGKTTVKSLDNIYGSFAPAEVFMSDGGKHFKNKEVQQCCEKWGSRHHVVAAYSPYINGLVEGTNKILLYILAQL